MTTHSFGNFGLKSFEFLHRRPIYPRADSIDLEQTSAEDRQHVGV
jgi:hypothetical protein